jgi:hypothetical protein
MPESEAMRILRAAREQLTSPEAFGLGQKERRGSRSIGPVLGDAALNRLFPVPSASRTCASGASSMSSSLAAAARPGTVSRSQTMTDCYRRPVNTTAR